MTIRIESSKSPTGGFVIRILGVRKKEKAREIRGEIIAGLIRKFGAVGFTEIKWADKAHCFEIPVARKEGLQEALESVINQIQKRREKG